jgi:hypothetical protein
MLAYQHELVNIMIMNNLIFLLYRDIIDVTSYVINHIRPYEIMSYRIAVIGSVIKRGKAEALTHRLSQQMTLGRLSVEERIRLAYSL